jgi:hypothetical protein
MTYNDSHDIAPGVDSLNGTSRHDLPVLCHSGPLFWPRGLRAGALDVDDCTNFIQSDAEIKGQSQYGHAIPNDNHRQFCSEMINQLIEHAKQEVSIVSCHFVSV